MHVSFSGARFRAVFNKEFIQMRRDKVTFAMMIGIPVLQLILFGYAINSDPKHLPTGVFVQEHSVFSRTLLAALRTSGYFDLVWEAKNETEITELLERGEVQFVIHVPQDFSRKLVRGEGPSILLQCDGSDPAATSNATAALQRLLSGVINRDLRGPIGVIRVDERPIRLVVHNHFNEERRSELNIVPGLMGVVLTMTMVIITALAITREKERGTMEALLASPLHPVEVISGKVIPYILVGYLQAAVILVLSVTLFDVPLGGHNLLIILSLLAFITANLALGITISTIARNQLQAMQLSFFFFLPSILLSGFMFPFRGMPGWAQFLGEVFPLTHFLRIIRGVMLKNNGVAQAWGHFVPLLLFLSVVMFIGVCRYRRTIA